MRQKSQFPKSLKRKYKAAIDTAEKEKSAAAGGLSMDCSKTINFLSEFKRLCDSRDECVASAANKEQCPMFGVCRLTHSKICAENIKTAIETVQKWSDEHPKKTYAQDFFEKFPKAQSKSDGSPFVCRKRIYRGARPAFEDCDYTGSCKNCWNELMEAADDE